MTSVALIICISVLLHTLTAEEILEKPEERKQRHTLHLLGHQTLQILGKKDGK